MPRSFEQLRPGAFSARGGDVEGCGFGRDGLEQRGPIGFESSGTLSLEGLAQRVDVDAVRGYFGDERSAAP